MAVSNNNAVEKNGRQAPAFIKSILAFTITFVLMLVTWFVLSGKFDPLLIVLGVFSSGFISFYFYDLLFPMLKPGYGIIFLRFINYLPWLMIEIIKANFHLLYLAFHPRMNDLIDPHIITFKTSLKSDIAIATLANSITLTPGTITVTADSDGIFRVHAIDKDSSDALPGKMLEKVAHIFGEKI